MKVSVLLLCLAVLLAVLLPETSGGRLSKRRNGRRSNGNKGRFQNLKRKLARRGRQDEDAPEEAVNDLDEAAADDGSGSGEELPNGCDPNTNIGGFLVFKGVKIWCGEQGITDFGPCGGLPVDGSGEASDVEGEEVEAPEEEEVVRRGRKAKRGGPRRGKQNKARKGKKAGKANNKRQGRRRQANNRKGKKAGPRRGKQNKARKGKKAGKANNK